MRAIKSLFRDAAKLDIFDLNFIYANEKAQTLTLPPGTVNRKGKFVRFLFFWAKFFREGLDYRKRKRASDLSNNIWGFVVSKNQHDALADLKERIPEFYILIAKISTQQNFSLFPAYCFSVLFIPFVVVKYFKAKGYVRKSFDYVLDEYILSYGFYIQCRLMLKKHKPKVLVVSNDHNMMPRTFVKAAKDVEINTVYIQHAAVSDIFQFPPLNFDYSLLEGEDTLDKYNSFGRSSSRVFLVGMPKLDKYFKDINNRASVQTIGICTNALDDLVSVESVCEKLCGKFSNINFVLRHHPAERQKKKYEALCARLGILYSNPLHAGAFAFLQNVDLIIAGDSTIILEAMLLNVEPIRYSFSDKVTDQYGFIRDGLVKNNNTFCELENELNKRIIRKNNVRSLSKYYNAVVNTSFDGKTVDLIISILRSILNPNIPSGINWEQRSKSNIKNAFMVK